MFDGWMEVRSGTIPSQDKRDPMFNGFQPVRRTTLPGTESVVEVGLHRFKKSSDVFY
jgi:hypothetical protein